MATKTANHLSPNNHYPFALLQYFTNDVRIHEKQSVSNALEFPRDLQQLLIENNACEYVDAVANIFVNLIYYAQLLRYYINAYSPLVLFSWWRNKIS